GAALAQANVIPGRDLRLQDAFWIERYVRTGTYPNGVQAIGTWTVVCNPGTSDIPFLAPMNPLHAFIHYMVLRESDGRLVQVSNWAWVKHTFGSSNDPSPCGNCPMPGLTSYVVQGCNDTYANSQAVDHFNLGPPEEIDPWLGTWNPVCSHFDRGNPPVAPAQQCDGIRSLTQAQAAVLNQAIGNAMRVYDDDLAVPGANFFYQAGYLIPHEADALRDDNLGSRQFTATWNPGSQQWDLADSSAFQQGSVLQRWTGAAIDSNANGVDDGRYYVAVKVTGPTNGRYHYEYAVQNRDNLRGMGAFRIPVCPDAQVTGFGFHDFDRQAISDWTAAKVGSEIVFQVNALSPNPLRWNSIFNFWFDCDAAPQPGATLLDQYDVGPGALVVAVPSSTPSGLWNQNLGAGCGNPNAPTLHGVGTPARAAIPNAGFALRSTGNPAGAPCGFLLSTVPGSTPLGGGCVAWTGDVFSLVGPLTTVADGSGVTTLGLAVPNNPSLEGQYLDLQLLNIAPAGAFLGAFNLSNGLRVRIGNLIAGCP
ncbi:MAG TPA: hypothetical protein VFT55_09305, partial [Planctomycetota bacterium]|nr:hypothetical protein [Planctomycetota bacterium]